MNRQEKRQACTVADDFNSAQNNQLPITKMGTSPQWKLNTRKALALLNMPCCLEQLTSQIRHTVRRLRVYYTVKITKGKSVQITHGLKQLRLAVVDETSELKRQKNPLEKENNYYKQKLDNGKLAIKLLPGPV
jgi:hypothetical protein